MRIYREIIETLKNAHDSLFTKNSIYIYKYKFIIYMEFTYLSVQYTDFW